MLNRGTMKQRGFFNCDAGINKRQWIENAKAEGYATLDCGQHVELWSPMTPSERTSHTK